MKQVALASSRGRRWQAASSSNSNNPNPNPRSRSPFSPQALRKLRLPRPRAAGIDLPVGDANLWLGGAKEGKPIRTCTKTPDPTCSICCRGARGTRAAPRDEARLQPATLLDVQSVQAEVSHHCTPALRLDEGLWAQDVHRLLNPIPDPGLVPRDADRLLFDHQHYAATLESVRSMPAHRSTSPRSCMRRLRSSRILLCMHRQHLRRSTPQEHSLLPAHDEARCTLQAYAASTSRRQTHSSSRQGLRTQRLWRVERPTISVQRSISFTTCREALSRSLGGAGKRWLMGRHVQCGSS